jgi:hypothetical protein
MTSPTTQVLIASISTVVVVVLAPTATANPPPFVSLTAVQAGGFSAGTENSIVHVPLMGIPTRGAPIVTLPATSEPTMLAPLAPQSGASNGVAATEAAGQHSTAAPANRAMSALLVFDRYRRMFTAPALCFSLKTTEVGLISTCLLAERRARFARRSGHHLVYGPRAALADPGLFPITTLTSIKSPATSDTLMTPVPVVLPVPTMQVPAFEVVPA